METADPPQPGSLGRVLLFDDDALCLAGFVRYLGRCGFDAVGCSNPARIEALALEGGFDAGVFDIVTPAGNTGHDLISRLRARPQTARLPILATSGYPDVLEEALRLGADEAAFKDFDGVIVPLLERICREARASARILVVEDDPQFAELLERILHNAPARYAARTCASLQQAARLLAAWRPQLVLLDLHLSDGDGLGFLGELRERRAAGELGVIVVSAAPRLDLSPVCIDMGADDFLSKPVNHDDLLARVARTLRHVKPQEAVPPTSWGRLSFDWAARTAAVNGCPAGLTPTEFGVLELLVKAGGELVPTPAILAAVLGVSDADRLKGGRKALCVHVFNLRRKLGPRLVVNVPGVGYRLARRPGA